MTAITVEWLKDHGFLQCGEDDSLEYSQPIYSKDEQEDELAYERIGYAAHLLVSVEEQTIWLEVYAKEDAKELLIIELPGNTQEHVAKLCEALGIDTTQSSAEKRLTACPHSHPHVYCQECKVSPCPLGLD